MEVYIEYVIIDNFIINYLILFFTAFTIGTKIKKINMFISTMFGVICSVIYPLFTLNALMVLPLKIAIGILMILMLKKYSNFKQFLIHILLFFTFTFVFGGLCFAVLNILNLKTSTSGILINGYEIPLGVIVLLLAIYIYYLIKLIQYVRHKNNNINFYFDVILKIDNKNHLLRGYLDSGNKLYDNQSNLPVVVISFKTFCKLFSKISLENYFLNKPEDLGLKNAHYINVDNVVGAGKMLVFSVDEIIVENNQSKKTNKNFLLGVSEKSFSSEFECLLHSELLKG